MVIEPLQRVQSVLLVLGDIPDWDTVARAHIGLQINPGTKNAAPCLRLPYPLLRHLRALTFKGLGMQGASPGSTAGLGELRVDCEMVDGIEVHCLSFNTTWF